MKGIFSKYGPKSKIHPAPLTDEVGDTELFDMHDHVPEELRID